MPFNPHDIGLTKTGYCPPKCEGIVRVGSLLYGVFPRNTNDYPAYFSDPPLLLYVSSDAGLTWTEQSNHPGNNAIFGTMPWGGNAPTNWSMIQHQNKLYLFTCVLGGHTANGIWVTTLDLTAPTGAWTAWTGLGLSTSTTTAAGHRTFFAGSRLDGTILIAYPPDDGGFSSFTFLQITQYDANPTSPTCTPIGRLGYEGPGFHDPFTGIYFGNGLVRSSGIADLFFTIVYFDGFGDETVDFAHVSVATDNTVSAIHTIESNIEPANNGFFISIMICPGDSNATTVGIAYQRNGVTNQSYPTFGFGDLRVAFGDTSGDALNPSWTTGSVIDGQMSDDPNRQGYYFASLVYIGSIPWVYWISCYPLNEFDSSQSTNRTWKLWRSRYVNSAWATPEQWFAPSGTYPENKPVSEMFLVKSFGSSGVGIFVDLNSYASNPAIAYDGPPLRRNGFSKAGGPGVSRGSYASA